MNTDGDYDCVFDYDSKCPNNNNKYKPQWKGVSNNKIDLTNNSFLTEVEKLLKNISQTFQVLYKVKNFF